jgi:MFS family permease
MLGHRQIRLSLLLVACISFFATPYAVMMPLFAREIFGGDARTYGLLVASAGAGALLGSLFLATRDDTERLNHWVSLAAPAVGVSLALFSVTPTRWLAFPILIALGFSVIITIAGSNTLIQTRLDEDFRGRVMAIYSMAFLGVAPLGSLAVGSLAHGQGIRQTFVICGLITLAVGAIYRFIAIREARNQLVQR